MRDDSRDRTGVVGVADPRLTTRPSRLDCSMQFSRMLPYVSTEGLEPSLDRPST